MEQTPVITLTQMLDKQWDTLQENFPLIMLAIIVLLIGFFAINILRKVVGRIIRRASADSLAADFLLNLITVVLYVLLISVVVSLLGWSAFTNRILTAAGLTTFVVGFALKDIGENFLAGILMAFRRPFREGDFIEISSFRGRVVRMSLRETIIKTLDGRDVYIPNSVILKTPLENYTYDRLLRGDFIIGLDYQDNVSEAIALIIKVMNNMDEVEDTPGPQALVHELAPSTVDVQVRYWFRTDKVSAPGVQLRSNVMLNVYTALLNEGYSLPSKIMEVQFADDIDRIRKK